MAMYWIKINTSIYDDPRWVAVKPDEVEIVENVYVRLMVLAGISDADGRLLIYADRPHTITTIATLIRRDKAIVGRAMDALLDLGFIEQNGSEFAISNWERLQFKADAKTREKDRHRKRKSPPDSPPDSTLDSTPDTTPDTRGEEEEDEDEDEDEDEEKNNNNDNAVVNLGKDFLQKYWPQISTQEAAIEAVAKALVSAGEDYVLDNIEYVRLKAKDNPGKYLADALISDYASHSSKLSQKAHAAEERKRQAEKVKHQREKVDEELRQRQASPEGQAELARLRAIGLAIPDLTPCQGAGAIEAILSDVGSVIME